MNIKIEPAMIRDLGYLSHLEMKAQDYPLNTEAIQVFIDDTTHYAYLATIQNRQVGSMLALVTGNVFVVSRISVHPDFHNIGVGKRLLKHLEKIGENKKLKVLRSYVPSYKIDDPVDPDWIGWWFDTRGFTIVGCKTDSYWRYGKWWDAYTYEKLL